MLQKNYCQKKKKYRLIKWIKKDYLVKVKKKN